MPENLAHRSDLELTLELPPSGPLPALISASSREACEFANFDVAFQESSFKLSFEGF